MKNTLTESTAFRTSLQVAEEFGKRHAQVLKDIRELECSEDFRRNNFKETTYTDFCIKELDITTGKTRLRLRH